VTNRPKSAVEKTAAKLKKKPGTAVARVEPQSFDVGTLITRAVLAGHSDIVNRLMDARERDDKFFARKAFDNAIAAAKAEIPVIKKNREVDFTSKRTQGQTNYKYEDLGEIARTIDPILSKNGLSYRYRTTSNPNEPVTCTCIISHRDGHSEENTLSAGRDESGNKNSIQAVGSTLTFLQRYTLKAALGLAAANDDDAKSAGPAIEKISPDQIIALNKLMVETSTPSEALLKVARAASMEEILASNFPMLESFLHTKRDNMARPK
jgi:hypothetical protein